MIFIDAHVHIYDCYDLGTFLDSALANFKAEATRRRQLHGFSAILLLSESAKLNWFRRLAGYAIEKWQMGSRDFNGWTLQRTKENCSLRAQRDGDLGFFMIAGRQIVTAENLEVLALITDRQFEDDLPLKEVIQTVRKKGAIPVIPWGFGKWMGRRGRLLKNTLEEAKNSELFLGDNGGRPSILPRPSYFRLAESRGIRILPGSDPLPFSSEVRKVGSFGFSVMGHISYEKPATDLKNILLDRTTNPVAYGRPETFYRFLRNQVKNRFRKTKSNLIT
jgi:hypothetical protein